MDGRTLPRIEMRKSILEKNPIPHHKLLQGFPFLPKIGLTRESEEKEKQDEAPPKVHHGSVAIGEKPSRQSGFQ